MDARDAANRDLLVGLLALQNGLVEQDVLILAFRTWTRDKSRPIADLLVAQGAIDEDERPLLEGLAAKHLRRHGGEPEKSLAALNPAPEAYRQLAAIDDAELTATIARNLARAPAPSTLEGDSQDEATASLGVVGQAADGRRFRVVRPHAQGGLGAVFVALDAELNREVALKQILDRHADDPTSRTRFVLEAEITGGLEHPGIVPVYGLGAYQDGRPYYAMRFIRGDSLKEAITAFHADEGLKRDPGKKSLALRKLLRRFVDICNAIDYAHGRGVLHRDIKPANVILGKHGETLVVDWGLAKPMGHAEPGASTDERTLIPSSSSGSAETLPGAALGTPAYMSPEQAAGNLERLGPRSDVYSLGATLYGLLVGKTAFEGSDVGAVLRAVQQGDFRPPRSVDPAVDPALESVCLKAMSLKPEGRYATARAMADDVERWAADEPVSAWREPLSRRVGRWARRNRTAVSVAAASVLVAVVGLSAVLFVQTRANAALKDAYTRLESSNRREVKTNADLKASYGRERARFALAQEAIRSFHAGVSEDLLLKQGEFKALRTKLLRGAREFYRKLERLLEGQPDRDARLALGLAYTEVGELTMDLDSTEEAQGVHRRALALFEGLVREDPTDAEPRRASARCSMALAKILVHVGRRVEALEAARRSRDLYRALAEAHRANLPLQLDWAGAETIYGLMLNSLHRPTEAMEAVERSRAILESLAVLNPPEESLRPELVGVYSALATLLSGAGRKDESLTANRRSSDLAEAHFRANPDDPRVGHELARSLGNLAVDLGNAGQPREALAVASRAREVLKAIGDANPNLIMIPAASAWINSLIASNLIALGRDTEALSALERAREAREILIRANPSATRNRDQLIYVHRLISGIHLRAARTSDAIASLVRVQEVARRLADDHPGDADIQLDLATADIELGEILATADRTSEASVRLGKTLTNLRGFAATVPSVAGYRARVADLSRRLGVALSRCGRPAEAASALRDSLALLREQPDPKPGDLYNIACAQSLLSGVAVEVGSGLTAAEGRVAADEAMTSLQRAVAAGWRDATWIMADTDLKPIRLRPDFQLLMMDLAFPADPFARGR